MADIPDYKDTGYEDDLISDEKKEAIETLQNETLPGTQDMEEAKRQLASWAERADEELHEDLKPWLEDNDILGPFLKHPLVYMGVGNNGEMNGMANDAYRAKKDGLAEARAARNWFAAIFVMFERPYRFYGFQSIEQELEDDEWWSLLGSIWTDSENIYQNHDEWEMYLSDDRPGRENMMEPEERQALKLLPEEITVYRGFCVEGRADGYSWTIDKDKAIWFAKRLAQKKRGDVPHLATGKVKKADVIAYFECRGESEIVSLDVKIEKLEAL